MRLFIPTIFGRHAPIDALLEKEGPGEICRIALKNPFIPPFCKGGWKSALADPIQKDSFWTSEGGRYSLVTGPALILNILSGRPNASTNL
jgi:hypothetical protein